MIRPSRLETIAAIAHVAAETGVTASEISGLRRTDRIAKARHAVWRRLFAAGYGYKPIARAWGCHHTTVMHGVSRIKDRGVNRIKDRKGNLSWA